jgi:hypothetical protein
MARQGGTKAHDGASKDRLCILVLGMYRSGTSALAGALSHLGYELPKNLMPPGPGNVKGHFESQAIYQFHRELLQSSATTWDDWTGFCQAWLQSKKAKEFQARALDLLASEFGETGSFVLKDPRICRFAPFWIDVLRRFGAEPLAVHTHRNPLEVGASLGDRNGFNPEFGHLLWLRHILDAEASTRGLRRAFTSYT